MHRYLTSVPLWFRLTFAVGFIVWTNAASWLPLGLWPAVTIAALALVVGAWHMRGRFRWVLAAMLALPALSGAGMQWYAGALGTGTFLPDYLTTMLTAVAVAIMIDGVTFQEWLALANKLTRRKWGLVYGAWLGIAVMSSSGFDQWRDIAQARLDARSWTWRKHTWFDRLVERMSAPIEVFAANLEQVEWK